MDKDLIVTDPRGLTIRCSVWYWDNHVLAKHPEMKGCETFVEHALRAPTHGCIHTSKQRADRHIYYGPFKGQLEIKVVVAFSSSQDEGIVVSVAAVSKRPDGEQLLWHK